MSKRISDELNMVIKEHRSCFNCTFFKIKPFKFNDLNNQVTIDFKLTTTVGKCSINTVIKSFILKTNKSVILRDGLKSINKYKKIAKNCDKYDGEEEHPVQKSKEMCKRANYKLVKYLF